MRIVIAKVAFSTREKGPALFEQGRGVGAVDLLQIFLDLPESDG
ncbi:MAG TPA: hypothetical protein VNV86_14455 [Candidatus Acidoferrum sp.]|nr:hypothetical protein [Candidatus Acidoferrum sp.]